MDREKVTIICRCNDVTLEDILKAIESGIDDFELLRKKLKIGFGPCQGRGCLVIAARLFARKTGRNLGEIISNYTFRPPLVPIPVKYFTRGGEK